MAEVEGGELEEVEGKRDFGEDEVGAGPEHNVGKIEEVEQDEMRSNTASCLHPNLIIRKQMPDISQLTNEHPNPVNADKDMVDTKRSWVGIRLSKRRMSMVVVTVWLGSIMGDIVGIVNCGDK